jgi:hypothetical protein
VQTGDLEYNDLVIMRGSTASTLAYRLCKRAFAFLYCYQSLPVDEVRKATAAWENDEALHRPGKCRARISYIKNKRPFLTREGTAVHGGRGLGRCAGRRGTTVRCAAGRQRGWEIFAAGECYYDGIVDGEIVGKRPVEPFFFM